MKPGSPLLQGQASVSGCQKQKAYTVGVSEAVCTAPAGGSKGGDQPSQHISTSEKAAADVHNLNG